MPTADSGPSLSGHHSRQRAEKVPFCRGYDLTTLRFRENEGQSFLENFFVGKKESRNFCNIHG